MPNSIKVSISALLCLCLILAPLCPVASAAGKPAVSAECAILIDADSGRVVWEKSADTRHAMASTTKIMTALVALHALALDEIIAVSPGAVGIEGSSVYLYAGEKLTLEDLLYAMLLESANDAAAAIAIAVSGSIEAFAAEMNACADEMGLKDTHFTNPHGLWDEMHYTTARELAEITAEALRLPAFRTIVSTKKKTIPLNETEGVRLLVNHNKLLKLYDGAIGVKTGYTKKSGRCLVSAAERNGITLIAVTLGAPDDWNDHTVMLEYGFSSLVRYSLGEPGSIRYTIPVIGGKVDYVTVVNTAPLAVTLPADAPEPKLRVEMPRMLYAPVSSEGTVGRLLLLSQGEVVAESPLVAVFSVDSAEPRRGLFDWLRTLLGGK